MQCETSPISLAIPRIINKLRISMLVPKKEQKVKNELSYLPSIWLIHAMPILFYTNIEVITFLTKHILNQQYRIALVNIAYTHTHCIAILTFSKITLN